MAQDIQTIVFDLGGVLVDWDPAYYYIRRFKGDRKKTAWFLNTVCTPEWNVAQDAGRTIAEGNQLKIEEFPEYEADIRAFYADWPQMFAGPIKGTLDIFEAIKASKKYRYYALTNWSAETWPTALELFPFLSSFEGVVVSGQEKTRKPYTDIYNILFERYQINPSTAVFIDDNFDNIEAAKELGMHAIHFKNPVQLATEIKNLGISY